jgi:hypothetical protein
MWRVGCGHKASSQLSALDEMLRAIRPQLLHKVIEGLEVLSKAGLHYPIPTYGIQMDPSEGLSYSYPVTEKK